VGDRFALRRVEPFKEVHEMGNHLSLTCGSCRPDSARRQAASQRPTTSVGKSLSGANS
jgi:hypothetical protein